MTLPSNSSMDVYQNNTAAKYTTILPSHIDLVGEWEVGLYEVAFPAQFDNVDKDSHWIQLNQTKVSLPVGHYDHVIDMLTVFMEKADEDHDLPIGELYISPHIGRPEEVMDRAKINIVYEEDRQKVILYLPNNTNVKFSAALVDTLGLLRHEFLQATTLSGGKAARIPRCRPFPTAYVYADIVDPVVVGDVQVQLLRTVNLDVDDKDTQLIHHIYTSPLYVPIGKKHFETIEINIMTDTGQPMPFIEGHSLVVLHFRRTSSPYFLP